MSILRRSSWIALAVSASLGPLASSAGAAPRPKYGPDATRLSRSHEYFKRADAPDFWAMIPYYVPQVTGGSCSVASMAMALNALRASRDLTASDELVTHEGLVDKSGDWKRAVGAMGGGVTLDELGRHASAAAEAYGLGPAKVEVVHAADASKATLAAFRAALAANEKSASDVIVLNFLQSVYTGDPEGAVGHIAPVGAYDAKTDRVLVLDPDRKYYEPYWVSVETALKGMATLDKTAGKNRGYVHIRTGEKK